MTQSQSQAGVVLCLFQEVYQEAERRLRRQGATGKVLSLRQISEQTGIDYRTMLAMRTNSLKQYDEAVVKRICLFFDLAIEHWFLYLANEAPKVIPVSGDISLLVESLPQGDEHTYGTIEILLASHIQEWNTSHSDQEPLTFKRLGQFVGLHEQTVAAWANQNVTIYQLAVLARWCHFFNVGVGGILRYHPPADLPLQRVQLPTTLSR